MCVAALNREKITKTDDFWISTSFKVIDVGTPERSSAVRVMLSSKSVSIGNLFHARRVNSGK